MVLGYRDRTRHIFYRVTFVTRGEDDDNNSAQRFTRS